MVSYRELWQSLLPLYDEREARAVVLWLLEVAFSLSRTDVVCGAVDQLNGEQQQRLQTMMDHLQQGVPVQYAAGVADFGPRQFVVAPGVLIPRPETYELCQWIVQCAGTSPQVLDVGTGSGCIACTLALDLPEARVTAWDISSAALQIAADNARRLDVTVTFEQCDALHPTADARRWDLIVSNPPYICECERRDMAVHVTDHEPSLALFVPDDDPLLFYRAIGHYAVRSLQPGGQLFFELNHAHAAETAELLRQLGMIDIQLRRDQFGRQRFLKALHP